MAVMMLDLRANPVLHEEQKMSNLPTYQFVSVFAQIQGSDKAIILFRNGRDCPAILHSPEFQPLSSSASHRPHCTVIGREGPWDPIPTSRIAEKVMIAERADEPGVPLTGSVQYLAEAHQTHCWTIREIYYGCTSCKVWLGRNNLNRLGSNLSVGSRSIGIREDQTCWRVSKSVA